MGRGGVVGERGRGIFITHKSYQGAYTYAQVSLPGEITVHVPSFRQSRLQAAVPVKKREGKRHEKDLN